METNVESNSNDLKEGQVVPLKKKLNQMYVTELKKELKCRLQLSLGKKVELQEQLWNALDKHKGIPRTI